MARRAMGVNNYGVSGDRGLLGGASLPGRCSSEIAKVSPRLSPRVGVGGEGLLLPACRRGLQAGLGMHAPRSTPRCPARGTCPTFLAMSSGADRHAPSALGPALEGNLGEETWDTDR